MSCSSGLTTLTITPWFQPCFLCAPITRLQRHLLYLCQWEQVLVADTSEVVLRKLGGKYQRTPWYVPALDISAASEDDQEEQGYNDSGPEDRRRCLWKDANVVSSEAVTRSKGRGVVQKFLKDKHLPAIDIDINVEFAEDTLTFHAIMTEAEAWDLAEGFVSAGLVGSDYSMEWDGYSVAIAPFLCKVTLIPSSTQGHFHLYMDALVATATYMDLLEVMAQAGVVEWGYVEASRRRKMTYLRIVHNKHEMPVAEDRPKDWYGLDEPF